MTIYLCILFSYLLAIFCIGSHLGDVWQQYRGRGEQ